MVIREPDEFRLDSAALATGAKPPAAQNVSEMRKPYDATLAPE